MGCANPEGATGWNIARQIAIRAGMPVSVAGMTVNRFCSSGLQTRGHRESQRILAGEGDIFVAGGVESISCVQNEMNKHMFQEDWLKVEQAGDLLADAADRRERRQALQHLARAAGPVRRGQPAQGRQGARRGQVPRRDRADRHDDEGGRQEHRGGDVEGDYRGGRRRHSRRHDLRRRFQHQTGDRGRRHRGWQCQSVLGWRFGAGGDERQGGSGEGPQADGRVPRFRRRRLRARRDGDRPGVRGAQAARAHAV